jgi:hypothetical protein
MIRRLNEPLIRHIQENEAMLRRLREIAQGFDRSRLGVDTSAVAALNLDKLLPDPSQVAELTKVIFAGLSAPESVRSMQLFAEQHREISSGIERLAIPYKSLREHIRSMSACSDATRFAAATIYWDARTVRGPITCR